MRGRRKSTPVFVILAAGVVLGAAAMYAASGAIRAYPGQDAGRKSSAQEPPKADHVTHYTPKFDRQGDLTFEHKTEQVEPSRQDTAVVDALNAYLRKVPAVPKDAVVKKVTLDGTTASVDFSSAIRAGYGTEDEQALVNGILVTLSQFPQIKKAQFLVEGRPLDSLGNIDLSEPQDVPAASPAGASEA